MTTNFGKFWYFFSTKMEFTYIQKKGTPRATTKNILQLKFLSFFLRVKTRNSSFMERPQTHFLMHVI